MDRTLSWLRYGALAVFALATVAVWVYQLGWVEPRKRCEAQGRWWSGEYRECAIPVSVSTFTGRPNRPAAAPAAKP